MLIFPLRARIYRLFQKYCIVPLVFSFWASPQRKLNEISKRLFQLGDSLAKNRKEARVWFHASSAGELESLWSVILEWARSGNQIIVTVFSESAESAVQRLTQALAEFPDSVIMTGYSPWEGAWEKCLMALRPDAFVTAKYEAWPDLWMSLSRLGIPLVVVGAKARKSFRVCKKILGLCGVPLPRLFLLTASRSDITPLESLFPSAMIRECGEPRWDRVKARSNFKNPRLTALLEQYGHFPRPWGVLAQVWKEDLKLWKDHLKNTPGTIWIVPHRVEESYIVEALNFMKSVGRSFSRTSDSVNSVISARFIAPTRFILLDEMGILSELYSAVDWAYIGGGFGKGLHSTIEPAIHGIPLAAGPVNSDKFPEVDQLKEIGQLTLFSRKPESLSSRQLGEWVSDVTQAGSLTPTSEGDVKSEVILGSCASGQFAHRKEEWLRSAVSRLGATQNVIATLSELVPGADGRNYAK